MNDFPASFHVMILLILAAALTLFLMVLLNSWVKLGRGSSIVTAAATTIAALAAGLSRGGLSPDLDDYSAVIFVAMSVPFGLKVVRAWTGIRESPKETSGGAAGFLAWLSPGKLVVALVIAGCAAKAFDYSFFVILGLLIGSLLIQPLANLAATGDAATAAEPSLAAEREKVLSLLEAGRITAEEGADLLNALGATLRVAPGERLSPRRGLVLIGAGLVVIGFFLPWFSFNPAKELGQMVEQMGIPMTGMLQGSLKTQTVQIYGGDVHRGMGWLVLLLGLGSAMLPYVATTMDRATQRMISLMALGSGGIVLGYLFSQNFRFLDIGLVVVLMGYVVEMAGALPSAARSPGVKPAAAANSVQESL